MASVLERAASAPRPAGPPAFLHASTSTSTPCSGWQVRLLHRRRPCALTRQQQVLSQPDGWHPPAPAALALGTTLHTSNLDAALRSATQPAAPDQPHPGRGSSSSSSSSSGVRTQGGAPPDSAFLMAIVCGSFRGRVPGSFLDPELEPVAGQHPGSPALHTLRSIYSRHPGAFTAAHTAAALERLVALGEEPQEPDPSSSSSSSSSRSRYQRAPSRQRQRSFSTLSFHEAATTLGAQLLERFQHHLGAAAPRDVAAALSAAAWLGLALPQGLLEGLAAVASGPALHTYTPQHLSRLIWALAKLQQTPPAWWLAEVTQEVGRGVAAGTWPQQSIAMALWALAAWQVDLEQLLGGPGATLAVAPGGSGHVPVSSSSNGVGSSSNSSSSSSGVSALPAGNVSSSSSSSVGAAWWASFWAATQPALPTWTPQHLAMVLAAAARLRQAPPPAWLTQWQHSLLPPTQQHASGHQQQQHTSQGLSQAAWALASLGVVPPAAWRARLWAASEPLLQEAEAQHLALLVWAAATWSAAEGGGGQGAVGAAPECIVTAAAAAAAAGGGQGVGANLAAAPAASEAVSAAVATEESVDAACASDAMPAAVDASGAPPGSWQQLLWPALLRGSAALDPHSLALLTWGGARLGWPLPPGLRKGLVGAVEDVGEEGDALSTALLAYGCSHMGVCLEPRASTRLLRRLHHHLPRLTPQGLVLAVQGLAGLAGRGSGWVAGQPARQRRLPGHVSASLLAACQAYLTAGAEGCSSSSQAGDNVRRRQFTSEELPGLLLGLARLQLLPDGAWLAAAEAVLLPALPAYTAKQLSLVLFSLGRLRAAPSPAFTAAAASRWSEVAGVAGGQDCGLAMHGGVALGWREALPTGWWTELLGRCEEVFPTAGHAPLSMMLWAAAQLPQRPSPTWLAACLAASQQQLPSSSLLSIATQLAALQALEYLPPASWMALAFATATARLRDQGILLGEDGVATAAVGQPPPAAVRYQVQPTWGARWGAGGAEGGWTLRSRRCVRLLREGAAWYQAHARPSAPSPGAGGVEGEQQPGREEGQETETLLGVWRRRLQGAAATASTDAAIAAAVGVAAAVARQHLGY